MLSMFVAVPSFPNIAYNIRRLNAHTSDSCVEGNSTPAAFFKGSMWAGGTAISSYSGFWKFESTPG